MPSTSIPTENVHSLSERELLELPARDHVPLAVRCSQRVFPFVGIEGNFNFWQKKAGSYLDAIECSHFIGLFYAMGQARFYKRSQVLPPEIVEIVFDEVRQAVEICPTRAHLHAHTGLYAAVSAAVYIGESFPGGAASSATSAAILASRILPSLRMAEKPWSLGEAVMLANRNDYKLLKAKSTWWRRIRRIAYDGLFDEGLFPAQTQLQRDELLVNEICDAFASVGRTDILERWKRIFEGGMPKPSEALQLIELWYLRQFSA